MGSMVYLSIGDFEVDWGKNNSFMMHGALYALMKTEGELHRRLRGWINNTIIFFIICYAVTTMATLLVMGV